MSKREEMRRRRQQKTRQRQLAVLGVITLIALAVTGWLIYQNTRPLGEIITVEKKTWPFEDGKVLGAPEATVIALLYSDFQ